MTDLSKYKQPFDPDWPHGHTYLGNPARLICRDFKGGPYVFAITSGQSQEEIRVVSSGGRYGFSNVRNAPAPKRTWWVNIYPHHQNPAFEFAAMHHATREGADAMADDTRIACIKVTEGEGLEDE